MAYIGDVPVEASYHGSLQLFRLLEEYPASKLMIVEAGLNVSDPRRRLRDVPYRAAPLILSRLQRSRLVKTYSSLATLLARARADSLAELLVAFRPEAILSLAHGYSWIAAAHIARKLRVPFYLICHDEWTQTTATWEWLTAWKKRVYSEIYQKARTRFCISSFMADKFLQEYKAPGTVLPPLRAATAIQYCEPPARLSRDIDEFVCAFAGSINAHETIETLSSVAGKIERVRGRLLVYGPLDRESAAAEMLRKPNIEFRRCETSDDLISDLRACADVLYLPVPFGASHRANMEINFPSKLTDYTAAGLPILIHGPAYSSAVKWGVANSGAAAVSVSENGEDIGDLLLELKTSPRQRLKMAEACLATGDRLFSYRAGIDAFLSGIRLAPEAMNAV